LRDPKTYASLGVVLLTVAAGCLVVEIARDDTFSLPIRFAQAAIVVAAACFLFSTLIVASFSKKPGAWRGVAYQVAAFLILGLSLRAFAIHEEVRESRAALASEQLAQDARANRQTVGQAALPTTTSTTATTSSTTNLGAAGSVGSEQPRAHTADALRSQSHAKSVLSVAELAAIMILFVLAEFAAFIGRDVGAVQDKIEDTLSSATTLANAFENARNGMAKAAEQLAKYDIPAVVSTIEGGARDALLLLLQEWARKFHLDSTEPPDVRRFADTAWSVILREYFREERGDFVPTNLSQRRGIPQGARPYLMGGDGMDRFVKTADVSYFASNIGFYAHLLTALVRDLHASVDAQSGPPKQYMRILGITSVLPSHWWNWPMSDGISVAYEPITELRNATAQIPTDVQTDRFLLVQPDEENVTALGLRRRAELINMLKDWTLLHRERGTQYLLYADLKDPDYADLVKQLAPPLSDSIAKVASSDSETSLFPILTGGGPLTLPANMAEWRQRPLRDAYLELHKGGGDCWVVSANDLLRRKLEGRYDITFFGVTKTAPASQRGNHDAIVDVWNADVNWQFCLMTSASPSSETMFLTVISADGAKLHFDTLKSFFLLEKYKNSPRLRDLVPMPGGPSTSPSSTPAKPTGQPVASAVS
jgi:hypothetical protein